MPKATQLEASEPGFVPRQLAVAHCTYCLPHNCEAWKCLVWSQSRAQAESRVWIKVWRRENEAWQKRPVG